MFLRGFDIVLHKTPLNKRPDSWDTSQSPYASDMRGSFQHAYFVGRIDCLVFRMPRAIIAIHQPPIYGASWKLNRGAPRIYVHLAASLLPVLNLGENRQCARSLPLLPAFCRLWVTSQLAVPTIIPLFSGDDSCSTMQLIDCSHCSLKAWNWGQIESKFLYKFQALSSCAVVIFQTRLLQNTALPWLEHC